MSVSGAVGADGVMVCHGEADEVGVPERSLLRYAGFWIRFAARVLDGAILFLASIAVGFAVGFFVSFGVGTGAALIASWVSSVSQLVLGMIYEIVFLHKYQATPGKMVLGIRVIALGKESISIPLALGRFFAAVLSGILLYIGYIIAAFDREKRALHDHICNTRVVRVVK